MKGFIVYTTYTTLEDSIQIQLFGRLENNQSFVSTHTMHPYLFIRKTDLKKAQPLLLKFEAKETSEENFKGEKVVKIISKNQADLNKLASAIHKKDINTYEADVKPPMRFLMDNDILSAIEIPDDSPYNSSDKIDRIFENVEIKPVKDFVPELKIASLDIESSSDGKELYCIGLYTNKYKKCFMMSSKKTDLDNAETFKEEHSLLTRFKEELNKLDPDVITGWNVIDFDLAFLKQKFAKNKIPFDIGRNEKNPRIRVQSGFFRSSTADIPGRQALDALNLIKDPFVRDAPTMKSKKFKSFSLDNVSKELLEDEKTIQGKKRYLEIERMFRSNKQKLVDYNLKDCELAYNIVEKTDILSLAIERSTLTGLPLDKISGSIAAFDSLYIREARKRNLVSPTTKYIQKPERITGGYVMTSEPGLYHNLLVLDFKSLYPSIIKTFNIDPASFIDSEKHTKTKKIIESPNKAYFKNQQGILPDIIETLHSAREKAKKSGRQLASYSIKIIQNSFFGVLASPNCRYFSLDMANAITHFGQYIIKLTAQKIEELGFKVIYSDTDSVFVETNLSKSEAHSLGSKIEKTINNFYQDFVEENYKRKSFLELEYEKLYLAFMMPPLRHEDVGSKKRYAGLLEKNNQEKVEVVGLEAIRGDWTEAAQDFQKALLLKVFKKEEFATFIKNYVQKIKDGKLDEKLIYKKSITKSLDKYTKTTPPHVKAARKLDNLDGNVIQYYMTSDGPEPIQKKRHKIDYDHYIEKQIKPIANTILFFFHKDFDEIIASSKQMKLF